jgi:uncharacterized protein (DUF58 family)
VTAGIIAPEERREIERLARVLRWGPAGIGTIAGRGPAGRLGRAGEFEEYRPWRPGEELRSIDVRVLRRLRRRVARVDREESALPLTVLVDRSASMADPARESCVIALATFFLALARARGEPRRLLFFSQGRPVRAETTAAGPEGALERAFAAHPCRGCTDFAEAFAATPFDPRGPGRVVVLSDAAGLAEEGALAPLARLGRPSWIAPLTAEEISPTLRGRVEFVSREGEPPWRGVVDVETAARYRTALAARFLRIEREMRARGGDALVIAAEAGWGRAITACLARGRLLRR